MIPLSLSSDYFKLCKDGSRTETRAATKTRHAFPADVDPSFVSFVEGRKKKGGEGQSIVRLEISRSIAISFVGECEKKTIVTFFCSRSTENSASLPIGITSWKIDKTQVHETRESKARLTGLGLEKKPEAPRNNEIEPPLF